MLTVGEALVDLLEQYGVDTVFGIPGTHSIELYRGLEKSSIRHILPRNEQGGGFMADGYARSSGRPGVCFVITGPGVTNITTPMGEAYMDSVPMLVISPVNSPDSGKYNQGRLHEITDQAAVTAPLTAFSATVADKEHIPGLINRAFTVFHCERPRPVHISIPLDIITEKIAQPWRAAAIPKAVAADSETLETAATMIAESKNALIIAGGGARFASDNIIALAQITEIPVVTTVAGRGTVPASHRLAVGAQLRTEPVKQMAKQSDLLIILGSELAQTDHWDDSMPECLPQRQIRINLNSGALQATSESLCMIADVDSALSQLIPLLRPANRVQTENARQRLAGVKQQLPQTLTAKEKRHLIVLEELMPLLTRDCTVVSDMTQLAYTAIDFVALNTPNSWFHPTGYGTLGYALPAAMGVCVADPEKPVLAIVGDAGIQYTLAELTLAAELNLNLTVLLWNNDALLQISDDMDQAQISRFAVTQKNPDFIKLAQACHWRAVVVDQLEYLVKHLESGFTDNGPPLLIQINENEIF